MQRRVFKKPAGLDEKASATKQPSGPSARDIRKQQIWHDLQRQLAIMREASEREDRRDL